MCFGVQRTAAGEADRSQAVGTPAVQAFSCLEAEHPHGQTSMEAGPLGLEGLPGALDLQRGLRGPDPCHIFTFGGLCKFL